MQHLPMTRQDCHKCDTVLLQVLKNSTEMYSEKDLFVGKVLSVHQRTFELLEADEFTYQYMKNNRHVYLMADWEAALKAIQAQLQGTTLANGFCNISNNRQTLSFSSAMHMNPAGCESEVQIPKLYCLAAL